MTKRIDGIYAKIKEDLKKPQVKRGLKTGTILGIILGLIFGLFSFILSPVQRAKAAWYNSDWQYRKEITISGGSGAGTNYAVQLMIGESVGSSGADFNLAGHCQDDFDDIRFTDNDGNTLLDYYFQDSWGTTPNQTAIFWVEVQDDLGSNQDIYIYYGNGSVSTTSNGTNTFMFFDDFNRADNPDITSEATYSKTNGGTWAIEGQQLKNTGAAGDPNKLVVDSLGVVSDDVEMVSKINVNTWLGGSDLGRMGLSCCMASGGGYAGLLHEDTNSLDLLNDNRSWGTKQAFAWTTSTWYFMKFQVIDPVTKTGRARVWTEGTNEPGSWSVDGNFGSGEARTYGNVGIAGSRRADITYFDNFFVRKVVSTDPDFSSASSEEYLLTVTTDGNQIANMTIPSNNNYLGGAFTFIATGTMTMTQIVISETGTVDANANLSNVDILYEIADTCTYDGGEALFGTAASFDVSENATVSGSMSVGTSQVCAYIVLDVGAGASNGQTVEIEITDPAAEVTVSAGSVIPNTPEAISGTTILTSGNTPPDSPASLAQKKTTDVVIPTGGWTNETPESVKFTATVTDPDSDQVRLCVEKDDINVAFSDTEDLCGDLVDSGQTASVTITPQTPDIEYHWQARAKDANDAYSSWVSYGGNSDGSPPGTPADRDYGIDISEPENGAVYDGDDGSQHDYNDYNNGSLTALSAYWSASEPNFNVSGKPTTNVYQYAIGTTQGGNGIKDWTYTGTSGTETIANATGLNLHTNQIYYFSVRAYDAAGNMETIYSSGQKVYPTLSFSYNSNTVDFGHLNNGNNWTAIRTDEDGTILTTSTNAYGGYNIYGYTTDYLTSLIYPGEYIDDFVGTWAAPEAWANYCKDDAADCGFGYTSSDPLVYGSNRFNNGNNYARFVHPTAPGNIVADHTDLVTGGTGGAVVDEKFKITYKVSVSQSQTATDYRTYAIYIVTANY